MIVKGPTDQTTTSFRMEDKGPVISIKFSPDQQVLAIQRTKTSVVVVFIMLLCLAIISRDETTVHLILPP